MEPEKDIRNCFWYPQKNLWKRYNLQKPCLEPSFPCAKQLFLALSLSIYIYKHMKISNSIYIYIYICKPCFCLLPCATLYIYIYVQIQFALDYQLYQHMQARIRIWGYWGFFMLMAMMGRRIFEIRRWWIILATDAKEDSSNEARKKIYI